jgi:hypothetical protein
VLLFSEMVLLIRGKNETQHTRFTAVDTALTGIFCALWMVLNLTLGPLSFQLLQLPVLHDFGVFFTLLLVTWATGRFGTSLLTGIIGSTLAIPLATSASAGAVICFAASSIVFDLFMSASHHKIRVSKLSLIVAILSTVVSAYFAGVLIGVFFSPGQTVQWALTFWGGWHIIGGTVALLITLPIIGSLEKANVRRILGGGE